MFYVPKNKGLPIGNLTSQLFGNLYLNQFDHFVKKQLKCVCYGRYVDDMFFMHQDKEYLIKLIPLIENYLNKHLKLKLHPKKIYIQEINKGLPFLGVIIKPHRIYVNKRLVKNFRNKIKAVNENKLNNPSFFNSYLGLMKHYNSYNLRKRILNEKSTIKAMKKLNVKVNENLSKVITIK